MSRLDVSLLCLVTLLAGCDAVQQRAGMESAEQKLARVLPDAKAVGAACRESRRALEDCYGKNPKLPWSGIFEGWKDMDGYMRDNQVAERPVPAPAAPVAPAPETQAEPQPKTSERYTDQDKQPERKPS